LPDLNILSHSGVNLVAKKYLSNEGKKLMLFLNYMVVYSNCFQVYMLGLLENLYKHTGFTDNPNDPQLTVYKRINILNWACSLGYDDCVRNSVLQFQNWRSSPDPDQNNP